MIGSGASTRPLSKRLSLSDINSDKLTLAMKLFLLVLVGFIFLNRSYSPSDIEIKFEIGRKKYLMFPERNNDRF